MSILFSETSPTETPPTAYRPFYESPPNEEIITPEIDLPNQASFLSLNNFVNRYGAGKCRFYIRIFIFVNSLFYPNTTTFKLEGKYFEFFKICLY